MPSKNNIAVSSSAFSPSGLNGKPLVEAATSFIYMEEIWKDIAGYESLYQISSLGKVKSLINNIILKQRLINKYYSVMLYKNGIPKWFRVARLVGIAFVANPFNKPCINHLDGRKLNNEFNNLEWCTISENGIHAYRILGNKSPNKGKFNSASVCAKKIIELDLTGKEIKQWDAVILATKHFTSASSGHISECLKGTRKTAFGRKWKYA